ncbi:MAG: ANTAR domain-containing protein [Planctomycetaceae bacterium]|nr:ANTAR domain-containing protein [Planctomycetaceae bacterium]
MDSALIVSCTDKSTAFFTELLNAASVKHIAALESAGETRRLFMTRDIDLVIVNAPLRDESGESLARFIASKEASQAILVVESEYFDTVSAVCEGEGILTISKPVNRDVFWSALMLAKSAWNRTRRIQTENTKLKQKIEEIRVVDRAKCIIISLFHMSEQDAHRFIEKRAMDMRSTRKAIAEGIIKTYDR